MARPAAGVAPPLTFFPGLLASVTRQYEGALQSGAAFFYPSKIAILRQGIVPGESFTPSAAASGSTVSVPWTIRCVPALLDKAREKHKKSKGRDDGAGMADTGPQSKESGAGQNPDDVFAPPYNENLLIRELPRHTFLLNKFCVVPKHFLLVTRDFEPQTMPPSPEMLAIAYRTLYSHWELARQGDSQDITPGKELMAFYNCGNDSGASQRHQHMQFAELGGETDDALKASDDPAKSAIAKEILLDLIPRDGKEEENIHALPLPYQHFVVLLGQAPVSDDAALVQYLGAKLLSLLDALFEARMGAAIAAPASDGSGPRKKPSSWNLLLTTRAMHLIPRSRENFTGLRQATASSAKKDDDDGLELVGDLSVNSLGYAGHLLVKSEEELEHLKSYPGGIVDVLKQTGVPPVPNFTAAAP